MTVVIFLLVYKILVMGGPASLGIIIEKHKLIDIVLTVYDQLLWEPNGI